MSAISIVLSLLGFVLLTLGTAVFVAAEFSLTALERSTVDANARTGGPRDRMVQRAHRTLSFQLSGAQLGISITTLGTGFLAEPESMSAATMGRYLKPARDRMRIKGIATTTPSPLLRNSIAIRTCADEAPKAPANTFRRPRETSWDQIAGSNAIKGSSRVTENHP
jgi:CBS domain containing-hemolysin-like protein